MIKSIDTADKTLLLRTPQAVSTREGEIKLGSIWPNLLKPGTLMASTGSLSSKGPCDNTNEQEYYVSGLFCWVGMMHSLRYLPGIYVYIHRLPPQPLLYMTTLAKQLPSLEV